MKRLSLWLFGILLLLSILAGCTIVVQEPENPYPSDGELIYGGDFAIKVETDGNGNQIIIGGMMTNQVIINPDVTDAPDQPDVTETPDQPNVTDAPDTTEDEPACTDHSFGSWTVTKQASCSQTGSKTRSCQKCGHKETETVAKSEQHAPETVKGYAATCNKTGLTDGTTCKNCKTVLVKQETIDKLSHTYSSWTFLVQATCAEEGLKRRTCTSCGVAEEHLIEKLDSHNYVAGKCADCGAAQPASNFIKYELSDDGSYYIAAGCSTYTPPSTLIIPSTYNGKPVKEIGYAAFYVNNFTTIILPDSIEKIGSLAFGYSYKLTTITIPASVTRLDGDAFTSCGMLETVYFSTGGWKKYSGSMAMESMDFSDPYAAANLLRKSNMYQYRR